MKKSLLSIILGAILGGLAVFSVTATFPAFCSAFTQANDTCGVRGGDEGARPDPEPEDPTPPPPPK